MAYPDLPSSPRLQPVADQPDGLLAELYQAQAALGIAEYYLRLWLANSATGNTPFRAGHSYAAHEAVHEADRIIDRIAEMLRIEAADALEIQHLDHSAQIRDSGGMT